MVGSFGSSRPVQRHKSVKTSRPSPYRYLVFHKPYGVLSQFTDHRERLTLKSYIPVRDVYPIGRLDRDSEGLMLLSNHGVLQHRLSDPSQGHPRTYWVQVERIPTPESLATLASGVMIQGQPTRPAQVRCLPSEPVLPPRTPPIRLRKTVPTCWLELTLREGRNRQVRRMTAAVGHPTLRLVRVQIGPLQLADLPPGQWRSLPADERKLLGQWVGLSL